MRKICLPFSLALLLGACADSPLPADASATPAAPRAVPGHRSLIPVDRLAQAECRRESHGVFIYAVAGGEYRLNLIGKNAGLAWCGEGFSFTEWSQFHPEGLPDAGVYALLRQGMDGFEIKALLGPPIEKDNVWRLADGSRLKLDWPALRDFTLISADGLSVRMKQLPLLAE